MKNLVFYNNLNFHRKYTNPLAGPMNLSILPPRFLETLRALEAPWCGHLLDAGWAWCGPHLGFH